MEGIGRTFYRIIKSYKLIFIIILLISIIVSNLSILVAAQQQHHQQQQFQQGTKLETPTPSNFIFPKNVTTEQETFAQGFQSINIFNVFIWVIFEKKENN